MPLLGREDRGDPAGPLAPRVATAGRVRGARRAGEERRAGGAVGGGVLHLELLELVLEILPSPRARSHPLATTVVPA